MFLVLSVLGMPNGLVRFLPAITWLRIILLAAASGFSEVVLIINGPHVFSAGVAVSLQGPSEAGIYTIPNPPPVEEFIIPRYFADSFCANNGLEVTQVRFDLAGALSDQLIDFVLLDFSSDISTAVPS